MTDHAYRVPGRSGVTLDRVSSRIAKARRDAGLTQRDLARRLGTSVWAIDELERGRRDPGAFLARIESVTAKPEGWLNDGTDVVGLPAAATPATDAPPSLTMAQRFDRNLVLAVFVVILTVRFLTESIAVLPSAGNFIDVLLLPVIVATALVRPAGRAGAELSPYVLPAIVFIGICAASAALNTSRVEPAPALLFLYGFLGPLAFFYAAYRLWPSGQSLVMSQTIVALGVLQFVVICIFDLPTFVESGNPDDIVGTFGGNAYQLVFFLLVFAALVAGISTFEPDRLAGRLAPILFGATFLVIFLAQYRALLVSTALTILLIGFLLGPARGRGFLIGAVVATAFVGALGYVATKYPAFKFAPTIAAVREDPVSFVTARFEPGRDVVSLYGDNPRFVTTGTGPGTYSSRAWRTFAEVGDPAGSEGAAQPYAAAVSGGRAYHSDVADRYVVPRLERGAVVLGSHALTSPFSSYLALLAEVGVIGFVVMVVIYLRALFASGRLALASGRSARGSDSLPALALATTVAFFLLIQMAFLENWWEVARVTIPSWILLAVCIREAQDRGARPRR